MIKVENTTSQADEQDKQTIDPSMPGVLLSNPNISKKKESFPASNTFQS